MSPLAMWNLLTGRARTITQVFCNSQCGVRLHCSRADDKGQVSMGLAKVSSNNYSSNSSRRCSCLSTQQPSPLASYKQIPDFVLR